MRERSSGMKTGGRRSRSKAHPEKGFLFEIAWEICNQLGGIYTVMNTKIAATMDIWKDRYFLIGPYVPGKAALEFEQLPPKGFIAGAIEKMKARGVSCLYGRWLVPGNPRTILIDFRLNKTELKKYKAELRTDHGIETPVEDEMADEVIAFGFLAADFLEYVTKEIGPSKQVLAHFHEWMGGMASPLVKKRKLPISTVFTTHGTLLGRYMSSAYDNFYSRLDELDPEAEAGKMNILTRYGIERVAARDSDVFTTVSELAATESEKVLGRKPDLILPNGLNMSQFLAPQDFLALHRIYKTRIHEFVMGHFFGSYVFDMDKTLYIFTAGRHEYRNKGIDVFIESLANLNRRLIEENNEHTVVAFIVTNAPVRSINVDVLSQHALFEDLRQTCEGVEHEMGALLFRTAAAGRIPSPSEVFTDDIAMKIKRGMLAWHSRNLPKIVTHDLIDEEQDPVLRQLTACGLQNSEMDRVKVVYHPQFMTSTNPVIGMEYYQFVRGCNMGVFPSYYEPWGYTPMESIALGVPSVSSDSSGFGNYLMKEIPDCQSHGLSIVRRNKTPDHQVVEQLTNIMHEYCQLARRQRIELRSRVERISHQFGWTEGIRNYRAAHALALEKRAGGAAG